MPSARSATREDPRCPSAAHGGSCGRQTLRSRRLSRITCPLPGGNARARFGECGAADVSSISFRFDANRADGSDCAGTLQRANLGTRSNCAVVGARGHAGARWLQPSCSLSRSIETLRRLAIIVPGGKIASAPAARSGAKSCWG